jgi:hypothetical protein
MVAGGLLMAATATPTMALWIVVLATRHNRTAS